MIGKLIIIGIIVILLIILIPNSSKLFQNMPLFDTVKEKIDHVTSDKYIINASKSTIKTMSEKLGTNSSDFSTSTNSSPSNNIVSNVYQLPSKTQNSTITGILSQ